VVVAVELSRLLRRGLLVIAIAAGGWLLSVVFAGTASADEPPSDDARVPTQSGGLLGSLVGGLTDTLGGVAHGLTGLGGSVVDTAGDILSPIVEPIVNPIVDPIVDSPAGPVVDVPSLLPVDSSSGSVVTDKYNPSRSLTNLVPETVAQPLPAPVVVLPAPEREQPTAPTAPPVIPAPVTPVMPVVPDEGGAAEHAGQGGSLPHPAKAPVAPAGSGTTVSTAHDNSGGARGTHGVLTSQATLHPADAGFTTRSRAVDAAGRAAGLPASSPD
jgi:hypothetical protein